MYAIVEIAGQQFKVEEGSKIFVHRLEAAEGDTVEFSKILLLDNEGEITIGEPVITGTVVEGEVLAHVRGDKVIVFKKKRRKGYQKRNGHRQDFTQVEVLRIGAADEKAAKAPATKKETVTEESITKETPVTAPEATVEKEKAPTEKKEAKAPAEKKDTKAKAPAEKKEAKAPSEKKSSAVKAETGKKESVKKAPAKSTTKTAKE